MPTDPLFVALLAACVVAAAALLVGMALAIAQALRDNELPPLIRWSWAVAVIAFPVWGAIAWFAWTSLDRPGASALTRVVTTSR
ncbi:hypothetical protein [Microbacterium halotolerans]|uniref:hypothetical protein n=1 Tax=Microbacterium halotolerans TaxID=246613 RepID=UPI000E6AA22B|nr:hypothetical protein [Microbacterium halotolerans]